MLYAILLGWALPGLADVILSDPFENGDLGTAPGGNNGGFYTVRSGTGGSVAEASGAAQITSAPKKDDINGMLSTNTVSLSGTGATTRTRHSERSKGATFNGTGELRTPQTSTVQQLWTGASRHTVLSLQPIQHCVAEFRVSERCMHTASSFSGSTHGIGKGKELR